MEEGVRSESRYPPLYDYGIIGDSRTAALISTGGSVDWCCWPNFDSPSVFGRLLDYEKGGHFTIRPVGPFRSHRRYVGPTNVLETSFETPGGRAVLTDLMPALTEEQKVQRLTPFRGLLRRIEGVEGDIQMELVFSPRPDYARFTPRLESRGAEGVSCQTGLDFFHLRSDLPLNVDGADVRQCFTLRPGVRHYFGLAFSQDAPSVYPSTGSEAEQVIGMTLDFWRRWSERYSYSGPYRDAVLRSALLLKLMAFAPSGAVVAAPTTSLPEEIGGVRNWDYRYCWLRDASFTVRALDSLGYYVEGDAFVQWMLHATRLTHPALQVMYNLYGETRLVENELDHLDGYCGSRPVRIGNGAISQFQIDLYGEVMGALEYYYNVTGILDGDTRSLLIGAADYVAKRWQEPDHGIWELRSGKAQHVHGKVMAWRTLDCAARVARRAGIRHVSDRWDRVKEEIRAEIFSRGYNQRLGSFVRVYGSQGVDGSLLTLPLVDFIDGKDPRMVSTIETVRRKLGVEEFIYRYRGVDDGLPGQEGAFLTCSYWLVGSLALSGKLKEANRVFEALLSRANDLGLFPEEMDPESGQFLGNYPQGLTHIALINAALTLQKAEG